MNGRNSIKTFAAMYCDVILLDSYIRTKDFMGTQITKSCVSAFVWLGFAFAVHFLNGFLMRKERSLSFVVALNIAFGIPEMIVMHHFLRPETFIGMLILFAGVVFVHARITNRYFEPVSIDSMIRYVELSVCGFIIFTYYQTTAYVGGQISILLFSAILIAMLAVFFARIEGAGNTEKNSAVKAAAVVGGITAGVIAICGAFAVFFSDAAGKGIKGLTETIVMLALAVVRKIGAAIEWLVSLVPTSEVEMEMPTPQSVSMPNVEMPTAAPNESVVHMAMIVAVVGIIVLLILGLLALRKFRAVKLKSVAVQRAGAVNRTSLLESLKRLIKEWCVKIQNRIGIFRIRNSAPGILLAIAKSNEKNEYKKESYESYGGYARRLANTLCTGEEQKEIKKLLYQLAEEFDRQFFAGDEMVVYTGSEAGRIKSQVAELIRQ